MTEEELRSFIKRDKQGSTAAWNRCNLCPTPDDQTCVLSCVGVREEISKKDNIKVTHHET